MGVLSGGDIFGNDHGTGLHTPVFYCPMTKKSEEAYNILWMNIITCVGKFV